MPRRRLPCCSITPPHIVRHMLASNDHRYVAAGLHTLMLSQKMMGMREMVRQLQNAPELGTGPVEYRQVFTAQGTERLPGLLIVKEGQTQFEDDASREAYGYSDSTWQLFAKVYSRDSIDGHGMRMISTVHYSTQYCNALWNGRELIFGDGDGNLFGRFTVSPDIIGHEFTHGVTQYTCGLDYVGQSGALNESISDCFGSMVKQYLHKTPAQEADWLIGSGLFTATVKARALRDMLHPGTAYDDPVLGKDPQPDSADKMWPEIQDSGGVHIFSSIPNKAFAVACTLTGGYSWDGPGRGLYETLLAVRNPACQFTEFAKETILACAKVFGPAHPVTNAYASGWEAVKVKPG